MHPCNKGRRRGVRRFLFTLLLVALAVLMFRHGHRAEVEGPAIAPTMGGVEMDDAGGPVAVPGEVLVEARDGDLAAVVQEIQSRFHTQGVDEGRWSHMDGDTMLRVRVPEAEVNGLIDMLSHDSRVEAAEPDYVVHAYNDPGPTLLRTAPPPNDPLYKYQWNMRKVGAEGAWRGSTGQGVVVAVIDTGCAYEDYGRFKRVEDMKAETFVPGFNFVANTDHPNDDHGHGTHVAATIAEETDNDLGAVGLAYDAKIMPIKVLSATGGGSIGNIADGIRFAADNGAAVINMSLGGPFPSKPLHDAIKYAHKKGVVVVCAAGNAGSANVGYPAGYPECICVSAVRDDNTLTWYSNRGKRIDIAAPGGDMTVDQNGDGYMDGILQNTIDRTDPSKDGYYLFQGTSMACPHVAAAAALLESLGVNRPDAVKAALVKTASKKDIPDLSIGFGAGILDANAAVLNEVIGSGVTRLLLGLVVIFLGMRLAAGQTYVRPSVATFLGLILGSSGFFFLPYIANGRIPYAEFLTHPIPQWDVALMGLGSHAHPLFYSALLPLALSITLNGRSGLSQKFLIGLNAGIAACLIHAAMTGSADLRWVPHVFHLDAIWLVVNSVVCMMMAVGLSEGPRRTRARIGPLDELKSTGLEPTEPTE